MAYSAESSQLGLMQSIIRIYAMSFRKSSVASLAEHKLNDSSRISCDR